MPKKKKRSLKDFSDEMIAACEIVARGDWYDTYRKAADNPHIVAAIKEHNRREAKKRKKEEEAVKTIKAKKA